MKVKQLIKQLQKQNPDAEAVVTVNNAVFTIDSFNECLIYENQFQNSEHLKNIDVLKQNDIKNKKYSVMTLKRCPIEDRKGEIIRYGYYADKIPINVDYEFENDNYDFSVQPRAVTTDSPYYIVLIENKKTEKKYLSELYGNKFKTQKEAITFCKNFDETEYVDKMY